MPVPSPAEDAPARRLLRHVVFDKILAAIMDGTLEPGEKLDHDDLVAWLAVSWTPIREALLELHTWGLVEMEAGRYTRIAAKNVEAFIEASAFLTGLHDLATTWEGVVAPKSLAKQVASAASKIAQRDVCGVFDLLDAYGVLVSATGNRLFSETELSLRARVKFLSPADPDDYDWDSQARRAALLQRLI
jgi:DNA-binding GntR family transcriptional regulator